MIRVTRLCAALREMPPRRACPCFYHRPRCGTGAGTSFAAMCLGRTSRRARSQFATATDPGGPLRQREPTGHRHLGRSRGRAVCECPRDRNDADWAPGADARSASMPSIATATLAPRGIRPRRGRAHKYNDPDLSPRRLSRYRGERRGHCNCTPSAVRRAWKSFNFASVLRTSLGVCFF